MSVMTGPISDEVLLGPIFGAVNEGLDSLYVWAAGQSNIAYEYTQYSGAGEDAFNAEALNYFTNVQNRNKSVGGSTLAEWVDGETLQTHGTALLADMAANPPASGQAVVVRWNWGEQNGATGDTKTKIKTELLALFEEVKTVYPTVKIVIDMLGDRGTDVNETYWQNVKDAYLELIDENDYIYAGAEHYDQTRADSLHYVQAAYETQAERDARTVAALYGKRSIVGTLGPVLASATFIHPSLVELTLTHDAGTDISISSAIEGIDILIDGTAQTTPTVSKKNATTLNVVMAEGQSPTSSETTIIYNNYGQQVGLDKTKVVKDNASVVMPLRTGKVTATQSNPIMALDNVVAYIDPRGSAKTYNTGTKIETITPLKGITGAVGPVTATEGPTFDTAVFSNAGGFTFDTTDRDILLGDLGDPGGPWTIAYPFVWPDPLSAAGYFFGFGASGGATDAQTLMFFTNSGQVRYSTNDVNAIETLKAGYSAGEVQVFFFEFVSSSVLNMYAIVSGEVTLVGTIDPRDDFLAYDYMLLFNSSSTRLAPVGSTVGPILVTNDVLTTQEKTDIFNMWNSQLSLGL